jgi:hypothetical protein
MYLTMHFLYQQVMHRNDALLGIDEGAGWQA